MKVSDGMEQESNGLRRRKPIALASGVCAVLLASCSPSEAVSGRVSDSHDRGTAVQTPTSLRGVLEMALDDERKAEATYQAVIDRHGAVRPFVNIIEAERRHASAVIGLMEAHGWPLPANRWSGTVTAPETISQACQDGIVAEQENIALYDRILPSIDDAQARMVLERLQIASQERHLPAFERCLSRMR